MVILKSITKKYSAEDKPQQFKLSEDVICGFGWLLFMTYLHLFDFFLHYLLQTTTQLVSFWYCCHDKHLL